MVLTPEVAVSLGWAWLLATDRHHFPLVLTRVEGGAAGRVGVHAVLEGGIVEDVVSGADRFLVRGGAGTSARLDAGPVAVTPYLDAGVASAPFPYDAALGDADTIGPPVAGVGPWVQGGVGVAVPVLDAVDFTVSGEAGWTTAADLGVSLGVRVGFTGRVPPRGRRGDAPPSSPPS